MNARGGGRSETVPALPSCQASHREDKCQPIWAPGRAKMHDEVTRGHRTPSVQKRRVSEATFSDFLSHLPILWEASAALGAAVTRRDSAVREPVTAESHILSQAGFSGQLFPAKFLPEAN